MLAKFTNAWKAIVAACGAAVMIWNEVAPGISGILPVSWAHAITAVVGVLTVIATYGVPPGKGLKTPTAAK